MLRNDSDRQMIQADDHADFMAALNAEPHELEMEQDFNDSDMLEDEDFDDGEDWEHFDDSDAYADMTPEEMEIADREGDGRQNDFHYDTQYDYWD